MLFDDDWVGHPPRVVVAVVTKSLVDQSLGVAQVALLLLGRAPDIGWDTVRGGSVLDLYLVANCMGVMVCQAGMSKVAVLVEEGADAVGLWEIKHPGGKVDL